MIKQPPRTLREHQHPQTQHNSWYHLQTPRNPKRSHTIDIRAPELDEILDQDTPSDAPLLEGHHPTADGWGGYFGLVDGHDGGG